MRHQEALEKNGELAERRARQARDWMWAELQDALIADLTENPQVRARLPELEAAVADGRLPAAMAAGKLLEIYLQRDDG
jgi:LAO/AO transport system kinase